MAQKRMFSKRITNSARFLKMPATARLLYYDLGMAADDDGVVEAFTVLRITGAQEDDLKVLIAKNLVMILDEEDLIVYISDWAVNNQIRKDRYTPSAYSALLPQSDNPTASKPQPQDTPSGIHSGTAAQPCDIPSGNQSETSRQPSDIPTDNQTAPPDIGIEYRLDTGTGTEISGEEGGTGGEGDHRRRKSGQPKRKRYGKYRHVLLSQEEVERLGQDLGEAEVNRCIALVDELAQMNGNKYGWKDWNLVVRKCHRDGWGGRSRHGEYNGRDHAGGPGGILSAESAGGVPAEVWDRLEARADTG